MTGNSTTDLAMAELEPSKKVVLEMIFLLLTLEITSLISIW